MLMHWLKGAGILHNCVFKQIYTDDSQPSRRKIFCWCALQCLSMFLNRWSRQIWFGGVANLQWATEEMIAFFWTSKNWNWHILATAGHLAEASPPSAIELKLCLTIWGSRWWWLQMIKSQPVQQQALMTAWILTSDGLRRSLFWYIKSKQHNFLIEVDVTMITRRWEKICCKARSAGGGKLGWLGETATQNTWWMPTSVLS